MQIEKVDTSTLSGKVYAVGALFVLLGGVCFALLGLLILGVVLGIL